MPDCGTRGGVLEPSSIRVEPSSIRGDKYPGVAGSPILVKHIFTILAIPARAGYVEPQVQGGYFPGAQSPIQTDVFVSWVLIPGH